MEQPREASERTANRSVLRACSLLTAFDLETPALTLGELAERTGLPKPTAHRMAASLQSTGFLTQGEDARYRLGFRLLELGAVVRQNLDVVRTCAPALRRLAAVTGETVLLAQVDWASRTMTVVDRLDSPHRLSVVAPVGDRSPIPPGCLGKAALLGLPEDERDAVARDLAWPAARTSHSHTDPAELLAELAGREALGYVTEDEEYADGVSGVGATVLFDGRWPMAAVGVVGPTSRLTGRLDGIGELVAAVATELRAPVRA
ncbi:IclR family transcriptional regulator [Pseudonocardia sp. ICBG1122]|nr:IclR family transcriptional regulator [Pseudonocardia pini]